MSGHEELDRIVYGGRPPLRTRLRAGADEALQDLARGIRQGIEALITTVLVVASLALYVAVVVLFVGLAVRVWT